MDVVFCLRWCHRLSFDGSVAVPWTRRCTKPASWDGGRPRGTPREGRMRPACRVMVIQHLHCMLQVSSASLKVSMGSMRSSISPCILLLLCFFRYICCVLFLSLLTMCSRPNTVSENGVSKVLQRNKVQAWIYLCIARIDLISIRKRW